MTKDLVCVATSDLVAVCRGRTFPVEDLSDRLTTGVGWVPANLALTAFGEIADPNPFGSAGDLRLRPDPATRAEIEPVPGGGALALYLADSVTCDGEPWDCCARTTLRDTVRDFEAATGLRLLVSFEHEFTLDGHEPYPAFSIRGLRAAEPFGSTLVATLEAAGLEPENWLPEYGTNQYEVTLRPAPPVAAADQAILLRELVRDVAARHGRRASFTPMPVSGGTGNGVHVHVSLLQPDGTPATHDPTGPGGLSAPAGAFAAGILDHAQALVALTASSVISYDRLRPHKWSSGGAFLGLRHREAMVRICSPLNGAAGTANLEYRAADATANPWLLLAALIRAGAAGIAGGLIPPEPVTGEVGELTEHGRAAARFAPLPASLPDALRALAADETVRGWFPPRLLACFEAVKHTELALAETTKDVHEVLAHVY
ncbi:glutamine synthetase family protein [Actinomadura formosensis]|uniref:glutamine synthetase family protein n=1 Tax=Actinomadura formosensis TaxID=60706 RepID=UPI003D8DC6BA